MRTGMGCTYVIKLVGQVNRTRYRIGLCVAMGLTHRLQVVDFARELFLGLGLVGKTDLGRSAVSEHPVRDHILVREELPSVSWKALQGMEDR